MVNSIHWQVKIFLLKIMINKEETKCIQTVYQKNGVLPSTYFIFVCDDLTNTEFWLQTPRHS